MHETQFYYDETVQSAKERQEILIHTDGHYDIQSITGQLNTSQIDSTNPPVFVLQWGNRSRTISVSELQSSNSKLHLKIYLNFIHNHTRINIMIQHCIVQFMTP